MMLRKRLEQRAVRTGPHVVDLAEPAIYSHALLVIMTVSHRDEVGNVDSRAYDCEGGTGLKLRDTRPLGMTSGQDSDIRYDK